MEILARGRITDQFGPDVLPAVLHIDQRVERAGQARAPVLQRGKGGGDHCGQSNRAGQMGAIPGWPSGWRRQRPAS
jgi:hypothetical protein